MSKNLVLTGMMGVGKSTVGRSLAKKLSYNFIDVDSLIEKKEGCSINIIFKNKGEKYFRLLENEITLKILKKNRLVVSLGGGAFLDKTVRTVVKGSSVSFWLDVSSRVLIKRLRKSKKRPLLFNKDLNETINKLYLERRKIYREANFRVKCNSIGPELIVKKILKIYEIKSN